MIHHDKHPTALSVADDRRLTARGDLEVDFALNWASTGKLTDCAKSELSARTWRITGA